jgi:hypothetical protein
MTNVQMTVENEDRGSKMEDGKDTEHLCAIRYPPSSIFVFLRHSSFEHSSFISQRDPMSILIPFIVELLKSLLPDLLNFAWEKAHEPVTVEDATPDPARRDRLLAAIRLQRGASGDDPNHPAGATG